MTDINNNFYAVMANTEFSSRWLAKNVGWTFKREIYEDPSKRVKLKKKYHEVLNEMFPEIYPTTPTKITIILGGPGITTMSMLFGCEIKYNKEIEPWAIPIIPNKIEPLHLKMPNINDGFLYLAEQFDKIREIYGRKVKIIEPDLQGPLNIAYELCGDKIFHYIGIKSKKHIGRHILKVVTDTYIEAHKWIRRLLKKKARKAFIVSECTSYFISPQTFEEFNLIYDTQAAKELGPIFVHSCGETSNEKIDLFTKLPEFVGAELGFGTDLKYARTIFKNENSNPLIYARIDPRRILNESFQQIREDVNWILKTAQGGPLTISCVGVPYGTPRKNIYTFHETCWKYNEQKKINY